MGEVKRDPAPGEPPVALPEALAAAVALVTTDREHGASWLARRAAQALADASQLADAPALTTNQAATTQRSSRRPPNASRRATQHGRHRQHRRPGLARQRVRRPGERDRRRSAAPTARPPRRRDASARRLGHGG